MLILSNLLTWATLPRLMHEERFGRSLPLLFPLVLPMMRPFSPTLCPDFSLSSSLKERPRSQESQQTKLLQRAPCPLATDPEILGHNTQKKRYTHNSAPGGHINCQSLEMLKVSKYDFQIARFSTKKNGEPRRRADTHMVTR